MFKTNQETFITILIGALLFTALSIILVLVIWSFKKRQQKHLSEIETMQFEFNQQLLQSQIEVQESTYRHIAQELHDNVGQLLSTTKMLIGVTEINLGKVPDTLHTANATLSKAIQELRFVSRSLDKEWLEQFNFLENLQAEVERINAGEMIQASVECSTTITMKPEEQIILFRMVQEAVQNAIRHAAPSQLKVEISNGEQLEVKVINNGNPMPAHFEGMGTNNMRHRAKLFGGTVTWLPVQDTTVVTICLPLNRAYEN